MSNSSVLILGAGINGAALARELALQDLDVCVVEREDIAFGATAYSSRLIHGGLRYLEYGEFDLVRESLHERGRLLKLAPQFVHPLQLFIPVKRLSGGLLRSAARFLRLDRFFPGPPQRGLWMIRMGLKMYDVFAHDASLPRYSVMRADDPRAPPVDRNVYHWIATYYDAQIRFPERFVVALFKDAAKMQANFALHTYATVRLEGKRATITNDRGEVLREFEPDVVVNATGAWVDHTLAALGVPSKQLMGGTKGSHLVCTNQKLRDSLAHGGLYAEADDGRPVFVLPFGPWTLVGTTDLPFTGDPARAVATQDEIDYLLTTVNELMPSVHLQASDILLHYSGVRPLPAADPSHPAAISRRHWMEEQRDAPLPLYSIIGGKLTTCRSLAEEAADTILARLGISRKQSTRDRPIVDELGKQIEATPLAPDVVRRVIREEWATQLDDLVERRLMLLYQQTITRQWLAALAQLLVAEGRRTSADVAGDVEGVVRRLKEHFGRVVV